MTNQLICSQCGYTGEAKTAIKGSMGIELILWIFFIIPGLIYSVWRSGSRHKSCPVCGSTNLIPINSPVGKKLLADQGKKPEEVKQEAELKPKTFSLGKVILIAVISFVVLIFLIGILAVING